MAFGPNRPPLQPHLCVKGGTDAIAFHERAFGAECTFKQMAEDGVRVMHASFSLFGGEIMPHDDLPESGGHVVPPDGHGGASVALNVNLPGPAGVDAAKARAETAGATIFMPASDVFWGARFGRLLEPLGHVWAFNAPLA